MQYRKDKRGNNISILGFGCMPCPKGVDIPGTFAAYNCVECELCERHCPQNIEIRKELKNARKVLENPIYKIAKKLIPIVVKY